MYKFKIITIGKIKKKWLQIALKEYEKRLQKVASFDWILTKNEKNFLSSLQKEKGYICLDEQGTLLNSQHFTKKIFSFGDKVCFVIGGDKGIPKTFKEKAISIISLSMLTFTHQITRLILLEQIYRSFEIAKKSPYHK